jgi:aspartyl-tRNA synthetase
LREHQERIGDVIDFKEMRENIGKLNHQYKNTKIKINGKEKWIEELVPIGKGLAIKIRDAEGKISTIANNAQQPIIYGYKVLEEFIAQVSM